MSNSKNYLIAVVLGAATSVLGIGITQYLNISFSRYIFILFLALPLLWILGIKISLMLKKFIPVSEHLVRYFIVGIWGAGIDFLVLNFASAVTGVTAGIYVGWINIPGFLLAVLNCYFLNKFWVFEHRQKVHIVEFGKFFMVAFIGLVLNSTILVVVTSFWDPFFAISDKQLLNLGKVISTAFVPLISFMGYKFVVFGRPAPEIS